MGTLRQKKLAKAMAGGTAKNKKELLMSAGYSESVADSFPDKVMNSSGVKKELEILGFTEENAKSVVGDILVNKKIRPETRINAAKEVFKVYGSYAPEKRDVTTQGEKITLDDETKQLIEEFNKRLE